MSSRWTEWEITENEDTPIVTSRKVRDESTYSLPFGWSLIWDYLGQRARLERRLS